jgi:uncharacterized repeat protein (TIGR04076 family)
MEEPEFTIYDLRVEVIESDKPFVCSHRTGPAFEVRGENIHFINQEPFSMYALAAIIPLLPAKQRPLNQFDWMATDHVIACPDPHCGALFKISRIGKRTLKRDATTIVPMTEENLWKE